MERQKYRLNLSFAGMYREIELTSDDPHPTVVGTTRNCNVRLSRENFSVISKSRSARVTMYSGI